MTYFAIPRSPGAMTAIAAFVAIATVPSLPAQAQDAAPSASTSQVGPMPSAQSGPRASVPTVANLGAVADGTLAQGSVLPAAAASGEVGLAPAARASSAVVPLAAIGGILAALAVTGLGITAMRRKARVRESLAMPVSPPPELLLTAEVDARSNDPRQRAVARPAFAQAMWSGDGTPNYDDPFSAHHSGLRSPRSQLQDAERRAAGVGHEAFDFRTYRPSTRTLPGVALRKGMLTNA